VINITPGTLTYATAINDFYKGPNNGTTIGPPTQPNSVYDGVIVRSPWVRATSGRTPWKLISGVPSPTKAGKITDGMSKTLMICEKYIRYDLYPGGTASDDRGWADGWDPDTMRCSCIPPLQDSQFDGVFSVAPPAVGPAWETFLIGSAHPRGTNAAFADGSVHTISYDVDVFLLNALGTRNGAESLSSDQSNL
jgi:prepilin-type processing-associated H-X9-DG protein